MRAARLIKRGVWYLCGASGDARRDTVVLRLTAPGAARLPYITDRAAAEEALRTAGPPDRQGRTTLTLPVESEDVAHSQLLTLGPEVEILQPASLRHRFADAATRMAGLYR